MPDTGRFDRGVLHPRKDGHFGRATGDARIAGALGDIGIRLRRESGVTTLPRNFCKQEFVQDGFGQVLVRQDRGGFGRQARRGGAGDRRFVGFFGFLLRHAVRFACGLRESRLRLGASGKRTRSETGEQKTCAGGERR